MKRLISLVSVLAILLATASLIGCGSWIRLSEEELYTQTIHDFFDALDARDSAALLSLFSETVKKNDKQLQERSEQLIAAYPGNTSTIGFDGSVGGDYANESGHFSSTVFATFPVIAKGEYYWFYMELTYEDDASPDNVGLTRVFFFTDDEYHLFHFDEKAGSTTEIGILLYNEQTVESELRCINRIPLRFTPIDRELTLWDVEAHLKADADWAHFTDAFGEPNAYGILGCYYETKDENQQTVYLEIYLDEASRRITDAGVVNDLGFLKTILNES